MASNTVEAFSLSHAAILGPNGLDHELGDIYGVRSASIAADIGNFDNTGDDAVLSSWFWFNFATVTVEAGYLSMDLVSLLSTTSDAEAAAYVTTTDPDPLVNNDESYDMLLYDDRQILAPPRPMIVRMPSRDKNGVPRLLDITLFRVQFQPISFTGPSYKTGLTANYSGRAVQSEVDETGTALGTHPSGEAIKAVGRITSRPA